MRIKRLACFGFLLGVCQVFGADVVWHNPPTGSYHWREISRTPSGFYAPSGGAILKSANGHDWTLHYQPTESLIFSIAESPTMLIGVAADGDHSRNVGGPSFVISTNGTDFKFLKEAPHHVYKIVYGNGQFVASGFGISRSADGVNWVPVTQVPTDIVYELGDLIFAGGKFLQATRNAMYVSEDGISWTATGTGGDRLSYYDGTYVVAGLRGISFSSDGRTWRLSSETAPAPTRAVAIGAPGTVAIGDSLDKPTADAMFSPDGTNWVHFNLPFSDRGWDIKFITNEFVMVGSGGLVAYSKDGTNWTKMGKLPQAGIYGMAKGEGRVVGVGSGADYQYFGTAFWSTNGIDWNVTEDKLTNGLAAVAYKDGKFVAVGASGATLLSTDGGVHWSHTPKVTNQDLYALTASDQGFIAVGSRIVIASTNGVDWEVKASQAKGLYYTLLDVAYGNGVYLAGASGMEGGMMISEDLTNWRFLTKPFNGGINVEFGNGHFVTGGGYISTDGTNWVGGTGMAIGGLTFSEGVFCGTTGGWDWTSTLQGWVSVDGLQWHHLFALPSLGMRVGRYFGRFIGIGAYSAVIEVNNFGVLDLNRNQDGSVTLQPIHPSSLSSQIESSTNMVSWKILEGEDSLHIPPDAEGARFFRLKLEKNP